MTTVRTRPSPRSAAAVMKAYSDTLTATVSGRGNRGLAQADMRRQLTADGLTPRTDPGAGLSRGRASMARITAQSSRA